MRPNAAYHVAICYFECILLWDEMRFLDVLAVLAVFNEFLLHNLYIKKCLRNLLHKNYVLPCCYLLLRVNFTGHFCGGRGCIY